MSKQLAIGVLISLALGCANAQWLNYKDPSIPRTKDGKPNLSAPVPRDSKGKPDLTGLWATDPTPRAEMERMFGFLKTFIVPGDDPLSFNKYFMNLMSDVKPEDDPIRPEFVKLLKERSDERNAKNNPTTRCLPFGIPWVYGIPEPYRLVQAPGLILMTTINNPVREIFTDGRKHTPDPSPEWLGYSVGKWDGDTLVVDTLGFNDLTWLDAFGHPHSENMRVTERFRRRDFGHMDLEVTIDDPKMYTKAFTVRYTQTLTPDTDVTTYICAENEKDLAHMAR